MELADLPQWGRLVAALAFVLGLMLGLSVIMRHFNHGGSALPARRKRRLQVVETLTIDARHRAVILRRDDREHLVILGANADTVIETGIESPQDEAHGQDNVPSRAQAAE